VMMLDDLGMEKIFFWRRYFPGSQALDEKIQSRVSI
jgi:hypothetical protein